MDAHEGAATEAVPKVSHRHARRLHASTVRHRAMCAIVMMAPGWTRESLEDRIGCVTRSDRQTINLFLRRLERWKVISRRGVYRGGRYVGSVYRCSL